ncbi:4'-phosphopantetheinyl transferase superfamily protein [Pseudoalteromonas sp. L1]|uniref:4'-phosphopantetheinyl transferase family protein n=1 Tax=Pseudoalteromonas sp. L1 TaxID=195716 RepID=UPI001EFF6D79|nr:4'-phosphopantetheinyl transferase superfamily protein [Pseudoalteromonas sp. L1]
MSSHYFSNTLKIDSALSSTDKQVVLMDASRIDISTLPVEKLLSEFELSVLTKRKMPAAKQEYIATRLVLKYLLKRSIPLLKNTPLCAISSQFDDVDNKLKLHFPVSEPIWACLSHSRGFIGAALNPEQNQFGFDIEHCSKTRPFVKLAKHFYDHNEVNLISSFCDINEQAGCFFRIWTLKEALAKATSQPIAKLLSPNVFTEIEKHNLTASSNTLNDFDISVVAQKSTDWQCSFINFNDLCRDLAF